MPLWVQGDGTGGVARRAVRPETGPPDGRSDGPRRGQDWVRPLEPRAGAPPLIAPPQGTGSLLVVRPHPQYFHGPLVVENLVDQPMLNVDAPRVGAGQVSHELFERRPSDVWVPRQQIEERLRPALEPCRGEPGSVLLGLLRVDEPPSHQSSLSSHSSTGVAKPSMRASRIPGIETR